MEKLQFLTSYHQSLLSLHGQTCRIGCKTTTTQPLDRESSDLSTRPWCQYIRGQAVEADMIQNSVKFYSTLCQRPLHTQDLLGIVLSVIVLLNFFHPENIFTKVFSVKLFHHFNFVFTEKFRNIFNFFTSVHQTFAVYLKSCMSLS